MARFGDYLNKRLVSEASNDAGSESIPADSREKEYTPEDKKKSFTYKPDKAMELPAQVMEIYQAWQNKELLRDIEVELQKAMPNDKLYHIGEIFGAGKLQKLDPKLRKDLKIEKTKLYVVGGAVRDFLISIFHPDKLHKTPKNYNLATDARPKIVQLILLNNDIDCTPGKTMGNTVANIEGEQFEIETFREDSPMGGKSDKEDFVTYTNASRDSMRRDFRANALRYDIEKEIVEDDVGGFGDIVENPPKLRTIKNPNDSFKQDPIRALRGLRLHGKLAGGDHTQMDPSVVKSLQDFDLGPNADPKKVHDEFVGGLKVADDQNHYIANFGNLGKPTKNLLQQIFPGLDVTHQLHLPQNTHPHVVLALVLQNNGPERAEKVSAVMQKMNFDSSEVNDVVFLLGLKKYNNPEQVNEFYAEMNEKAKKLVPSAIRNYVQWAKLGNAKLIDNFLKYRTQGKYPTTSKAAVAASQPPQPKNNLEDLTKNKEADAFSNFHQAS